MRCLTVKRFAPSPALLTTLSVWCTAALAHCGELGHRAESLLSFVALLRSHRKNNRPEASASLAYSEKGAIMRLRG